MDDFHVVAKVRDIADPGKEVVEVEDRLIALFHVDGRFYALDDVCTHDGGPLAEGMLEGYQIACPRHGARFDIRNGDALTLPATRGTAAHEVKISGDDVLVRLAD
jgi:3-phenylpropionate/trans-cinnamate dioxygenase ferredoxin subunit